MMQEVINNTTIYHSYTDKMLPSHRNS